MGSERRDRLVRRRLRMWCRVGVAVVLAGLGTLACGGPSFVGPTSGSGLEEVDRFARSFIAKWDVKAAQFAVVRDGRLVMATAYGFADDAELNPLTPEHVFRVASVSKSLTGIATIKAVDEGLLALDSRVFVDILPDYLPEGGPRDSRLLDITVDHLLGHAAGFDQVGHVGNGGSELLMRTHEVARELGSGTPPDSDDLVRFLARQPLAFAPGAEYLYTNSAYLVLGRVLEHVTGMSYGDYVRSAVLDPLGIRRPALGGPLRTDRLPGEVEYDSHGERWPSILEAGASAEAAYGGLHLRGFDSSTAWVMSTIDLARLGMALDGDPDNTELFPPLMLAEMLRDRAPGDKAYGAGWDLESSDRAVGFGFEDHAFWAHLGAMPGSTAYWAVREDGLVLAAAINRVEAGLLQEFVRGFHRAIAEVEAWPTEDLFLLYAR